MVNQLHRFITSMSKYHTDCYDTMKTITNIFPIEVELPACILNNQNDQNDDEDDDYDDDDDDIIRNPNDSNDYYSDQQQKNTNLKPESLIDIF